MALDTRVAQTTLENAIRDAILYALGTRLPAVATVAALRAVQTAGASSTIRNDDQIIPIVSGGVVTTAYRWSSVSTAADNGTTVIKPTDVTANGRWLAWTSALRFSPIVGGNSYYLHELAKEVQGASVGPVRRVIVLDKSMTVEEENALILGEIPSVVIEASDDDPDDADQDVGHRWLSEYHFTITVIAQNLRDRREAAQGSSVSTDPDPGANSIDGFIKALLAGSRLFAVNDGIRAVRLGRAVNRTSEEGQRRIYRQRTYTVQVTEENPSAPNDTGLAQEVDVQAEMIDLHDQTAWDEQNYVVSGFDVSLGAGLVKTVSAGQAIIAGATVNYAGELHTFSAYSDTYLDLLPNGTMTFVTVTAEGAAPAITATALRVGVARTDGSSVLADRYIAATKQPYMNTFVYSLT